MSDLVNRLRSQGDNEAADEIERLTRERAAALAGAVRVKSLVWKKRDIDIHLAQNYRITPFYGQGPAAYYLARDSDMIAHGDTVDDLKSTAQADHEARIRAAIELAAPSVSAAEVKRKYRLLKDGERTMPGDQRLDDNCETWFALQGWEVGLSYDPSFFVPMRRALATKENSDE